MPPPPAPLSLPRHLTHLPILLIYNLRASSATLFCTRRRTRTTGSLFTTVGPSGATTRRMPRTRTFSATKSSRPARKHCVSVYLVSMCAAQAMCVCPIYCLCLLAFGYIACVSLSYVASRLLASCVCCFRLRYLTVVLSFSPPSLRVNLDHVLSAVANDPTLQRSTVDCPKCHHHEAVLIQSTQNVKSNKLTLIFVCCNPNCGNKWTDDDAR